MALDVLYKNNTYHPTGEWSWSKTYQEQAKIIEQIEPLAVKGDEVRADVIKMQDDVTIIKTNMLNGRKIQFL